MEEFVRLDCFTNHHYNRFTGRAPINVLPESFGSASQTIPYGLLPALTPCSVSWQVRHREVLSQEQFNIEYN